MGNQPSETDQTLGVCPDQPSAQEVERGPAGKQGEEKEGKKQQSQRYAVSSTRFCQKSSLSEGFFTRLVRISSIDPYENDIMTLKDCGNSESFRKENPSESWCPVPQILV